MTRIISTEIEKFLDKEALTQKNLNQLEKHLESLIENDPRINELGDNQGGAKLKTIDTYKYPAV